MIFFNKSTERDYRGLILRMLPPGVLWRLDDRRTKLSSFIDGVAFSLSHLHNYLLAFLNRSIPTMADWNGIQEWERLCGIPYIHWLSVGYDLQKRRNNVINHLIRPANASAKSLEEITEQYDIPITITDGLVNHEDYGPQWAFHFLVDCPWLRTFRAGESTAGAPLTGYERGPKGTFVKYLIERFKPAHTVAVYNYGENEP